MSGTTDSLNDIVIVYGGATFDIDHKLLFAYTEYHNNATIEDLPIKKGCANHFAIYVPEKFMLGNGVQVNIRGRQEKINALSTMVYEYFGQSIGQSKVVGYYNQNNQLVEENIVRIEFWDDFTSSARVESLVNLCKFLKSMLQQESIAIEVNEDLLILV